jgi:hypothetical protein
MNVDRRTDRLTNDGALYVTLSNAPQIRLDLSLRAFIVALRNEGK